MELNVKITHEATLEEVIPRRGWSIGGRRVLASVGGRLERVRRVVLLRGLQVLEVQGEMFGFVQHQRRRSVALREDLLKVLFSYVGGRCGARSACQSVRTDRTGIVTSAEDGLLVGLGKHDGCSSSRSRSVSQRVLLLFEIVSCASKKSSRLFRLNVIVSEQARANARPVIYVFLVAL